MGLALMNCCSEQVDARIPCTRKAGSRFAVSALISVMQITRNRVAYHEKHVVHLIYKTRRLEKATDVKLIDNPIVKLFTITSRRIQEAKGT